MIGTPSARAVVSTVVGFLAVATLVWLSGPDMFFGRLSLLVVGGWSVLALYLSTATVSTWLRSGVRSLRAEAIACTASLIAFLFSVSVGFSGAPEHLRMRLSRSALMDAGQEVLSGGHPTRAALYGFTSTSVSDGCAILTSGLVGVDEFGWGYCPDGPPSEKFVHVHGPLYTYDFD